MTPTHWLQMAIEQYGYFVIFFAVAIESMGVPFPGETALIAGAVYAGTGGNISLVGVIAAAAAGAIVGDNLGYEIGRHRGYQLVRRFAVRLHINPRHLAYAQSYFERHGDKTVFFGRFFSILRTWAAFLAGVNRMPRQSFLFWNALGGIIWALLYGTLGYLLGDNLPLLRRIQRIMGWGGTSLLIAAILFIIVCWFLWRRGMLRYSWLDATWARFGAWLVRPGAEMEEPFDASDEPDGATMPSSRRRLRRRLHGASRSKRRAAPQAREPMRPPLVPIDLPPDRPTNGSPVIAERLSDQSAEPEAQPSSEPRPS
jgi:membrane protein DedA with SNARE-associated domain